MKFKSIVAGLALYLGFGIVTYALGQLPLTGAGGAGGGIGVLTITAGATVSFAGGGSPVALDNSLTMIDTNATNIINATVSVGAGFLSGDTLNFTNQNGITGSYNSSTGVLSLSGVATIANYQTGFRTVTYSFTGDPTNGGLDTSRTIHWLANDPSLASNDATSIVNTTNGGGGGFVAMAAPSGYTSAAMTFEDQFNTTSLNTANWVPYFGNVTFGRWNNQGQLPSPYSAVSNSTGNGASLNLEYGDPFPGGQFATNTSGNHLLLGSSQAGTGITTGNGVEEICSPSTHFSPDYSYACGYISSFTKWSVPGTGGYLQIRCKMPDVSFGNWGALWMLGATTGGNEIDIQENGFTNGTTNQVMASNAHFGTNSQKFNTVGVNMNAGYHVYGMEYRPGASVKTFFDGALMATFTSSVPSEPYTLYIVNTMASAATAGFHTLPNSGQNGPFNMYCNDVQLYHL